MIKGISNTTLRELENYYLDKEEENILKIVF